MLFHQQQQQHHHHHHHHHHHEPYHGLTKTNFCHAKMIDMAYKFYPEHAQKPSIVLSYSNSKAVGKGPYVCSSYSIS
jgi:hypothetical protein